MSLLLATTKETWCHGEQREISWGVEGTCYIEFGDVRSFGRRFKEAAVWFGLSTVQWDRKWEQFCDWLSQFLSKRREEWKGVKPVIGKEAVATHISWEREMSGHFWD